MAKLSLKKPVVEAPVVEAPPAPAAVPVFDPELLAVETYGDGGAGFIQGKNYFTRSGAFVRELPKEQWYVTTPEMERNNKLARAKWRAVTRQNVATKRGADIPDKLLQVSRENARARAAEALAE